MKIQAYKIQDTKTLRVYHTVLRFYDYALAWMEDHRADLPVEAGIVETWVDEPKKETLTNNI